MINIKENVKKNLVFVSLFVLELTLLFLLFSFPLSHVIGEYGENATVQTYLTVGGVYPEILNVSIDDNAASVTLIANSTKLVSCIAVLRDYNEDDDIVEAYAEFFHNSDSSLSDTDDNNTHYTNGSCEIDRDFTSWHEHTDDVYLALANCSFDVQFYATPGTWNCTVFVNDTFNWTDSDSDTITVNDLLSINLPETINYGTVNATYVSNENVTRVTNFGNVPLNLTLSGYGYAENDNLAMNCTLGSNKNISVHYEKFNLTSTSSIDQSDFSEFDQYYANLSETPTIYNFNLNYNFDETTNGAYNDTYWRVYVPLGVAGSCSGNIIFGATKSEAD